ncbi:MAG TPA: hypothetical protein VLT33_42350 [Labilithrix sp.]|nr:hypothetical protein [Labilithrix sp.]
MSAVYWIEAFAAQRGLRYEAEADERWLRAWEPYTTLKVPIRYEHALHATGGTGSLSIARAVVELPVADPLLQQPTEVGTWIAIVQDVRMTAAAATTSDFAGVFGEPLDLVTMPRRASGDATFDHVFASFAESPEALAAALTPSIRKLLMGWRVPVHAEFRPGGFVLAPVSVSADEKGLAWMLNAVHLFGEKATKVAR